MSTVMDGAGPGRAEGLNHCLTHGMGKTIQAISVIIMHRAMGVGCAPRTG